MSPLSPLHDYTDLRPFRHTSAAVAREYKSAGTDCACSIFPVAVLLPFVLAFSLHRFVRATTTSLHTLWAYRTTADRPGRFLQLHACGGERERERERERGRAVTERRRKEEKRECVCARLFGRETTRLYGRTDIWAGGKVI